MAIHFYLILTISVIVYGIVNGQTKPCGPCDTSKCPMVIFV